MRRTKHAPVDEEGREARDEGVDELGEDEDGLGLAWVVLCVECGAC